MSDTPSDKDKKPEDKKVELEKLVDKDGKPVMNIKLYSPFKTYFDELGYSISGTNDTGPFDILPRHHNFITLLTAGELVVRPLNRSEQKFKISGGMMHVKADQVKVFLDI